MNPLLEAVLLLEKEDIRAFKLYANRTQKSGERQDLALFDLIRESGEDYDDDAAYQDLYPGMAKNTFHRLKSRLLNEINRSLAHQYLDKYDALKIYHYLSVIEFYLQKRHFGLAHWFLRKAERLAKKMGNYEALDIIYTEYIRLAQEGMLDDPKVYIDMREANQKDLARIRQLDNVLVMAIHRAKVTQTYGAEGSEFMQLLQETVQEFAAESLVRESPKVRISMFDAISKILLDKKEYQTLATYCKSTLEEFEAENMFTKTTHRTKLNLLTYLANSLFKLGDYEGSLYYANRLRVGMKAFNGFLQDRYLFFYYNTLVINYFKIDLDKAVATLEEMYENEAIMNTTFYKLFVVLNLALVWNEKENFKKAIKYFVQLGMMDAFKAAGPELQLRISVGEIMVRYELGEYEVVMRRIGQVKREFGDLLRRGDFWREKELLGFIGQMNESLEPKRDKKLMVKVAKFLGQAAEEEELDAEIIGYSAFLSKHLSI